MELVERPFREFYHHVVERGLETGARLSRHVVLDLVERVAERDLSGDLRYRVSGRLAGERGRARHARVDLYDGVVEAFGVERELAVAPSDDAERRDYVQRRAAERLILPVRERQRGSDDDGVAGVDADRVDVLHRADRDHVALAVAHRFKFYFFPAVDIFFDEDLTDRRRGDTRRGDRFQFLRAVRDAAAAAAERVRGADDDGISDRLGDLQRFFDVVRRVRRDRRFADRRHRVLEELPVFRLLYRVDVRPDEADAVLFEEPVLVKFYGERQPRLTAQTGEQAVGFFFFDYSFYRLDGERFEVDFFGEVGVSHDRRGVRVDEDRLDPLRFENAARLRSGVVELRSLTDDDGTGADDHYLADRVILWHCVSPPSSGRTGRKETRCHAGRFSLRGGTAQKTRDRLRSRSPRTFRRSR